MMSFTIRLSTHKPSVTTIPVFGRMWKLYDRGGVGGKLGRRGTRRRNFPKPRPQRHHIINPPKKCKKGARKVQERRKLTRIDHFKGWYSLAFYTTFFFLRINAFSVVASCFKRGTSRRAKHAISSLIIERKYSHSIPCWRGKIIREELQSHMSR